MVKVLKTPKAPAAQITGPMSMIYTNHKSGPHITELMTDFRLACSPQTYGKLKIQKYNKFKDVLGMTSTLSVNNLIIFGLGSTSATLRFINVPKGPTISFNIDSYCLAKDVRKIAKNSFDATKIYSTPPLLLLDSFDDSKICQIISSEFSSLFQKIDLKNLKIGELKRVLLLKYDSIKEVIHLRHYSISLKKIETKNFLQKSKLEFGEAKSMAEAIGKEIENIDEQYSLKLVELGPRMDLSCVMIQEGINGEILWKK